MLFFYSGISIYLIWIRIRNANRSAIEFSTWKLEIYYLSYIMGKKRQTSVSVPQSNFQSI